MILIPQAHGLEKHRCSEGTMRQAIGTMLFLLSADTALNAGSVTIASIFISGGPCMVSETVVGESYAEVSSDSRCSDTGDILLAYASVSRDRPDEHSINFFLDGQASFVNDLVGSVSDPTFSAFATARHSESLAVRGGP